MLPRRIAILVASSIGALALFAVACGGDDNQPGIVATVSGAATSVSGAGTAVSETVEAARTSVSGTVTAFGTPLGGTVTAAGTSVRGTVTAGSTNVAGTVTAARTSVATAVSGAQGGGAAAQVCIDAAVLKASLDAIAGLSSSSTVAEARQYVAAAQQSINSLRTTAQQAYAAAYTDLQNAFNNLATQVNSIPGSQTLGAAATQLQDYASTLQLADSNFANQASCPGF